MDEGKISHFQSVQIRRIDETREGVRLPPPARRWSYCRRRSPLELLSLLPPLILPSVDARSHHLDLPSPPSPLALTCSPLELPPPPLVIRAAAAAAAASTCPPLHQCSQPPLDLPSPPSPLVVGAVVAAAARRWNCCHCCLRSYSPPSTLAATTSTPLPSLAARPHLLTTGVATAATSRSSCCRRRRLRLSSPPSLLAAATRPPLPSLDAHPHLLAARPHLLNARRHCRSTSPPLPRRLPSQALATHRRRRCRRLTPTQTTPVHKRWTHVQQSPPSQNLFHLKSLPF